jgi:hypothetical protein
VPINLELPQMTEAEKALYARNSWRTIENGTPGEFSSVKNKKGGSVYTSNDKIIQDDFADIVDEASKNKKG